MALIFETRDKVIWDSSLETSLNDPLIITIKRDNPSIWMRLLILLKLRKARISFPILPPKLRLAEKLCQLFLQIDAIPYKDQMKQWEAEIRTSNHRKIAEIVATFIYNKPKRRTPSHLTDFILDNVDEQSLFHIMGNISRQMDISPLIQAIAQVRSLDIISSAIQQEDEVQSKVQGI